MFPEYKILNKIGEGSFSEVLKCKDVRTGEYLAAKRLKKTFDTYVYDSPKTQVFP